MFLLFGMGLIQLYGQVIPPPPNGKTGESHLVFESGWSQDIYCHGVLSDVLTGNVTIKEVDHWKDMQVIYGKNIWIDCTLTSINTNEVFTLHQVMKGFPPLDALSNYTNGYWHYNLVATKGIIILDSFHSQRIGHLHVLEQFALEKISRTSKYN